MKFGTETVGKHAIAVEIDGRGTFSAEFNDEDFSAPTHKELVEMLRKAVRKASKVKPVEVTILGLVPKTVRKSWDNELFIDGAGTIDAQLRGRHSRNRVYLLKTENGSKFQLSEYGRKERPIVRRLTEVEKQQYLTLLEAQRVAATALEDFIGEVSINPDQALAAAAKAGGE